MRWIQIIYTKRGINILSFIISTIIFLILIIFIENIKKENIEVNIGTENKIIEELEKESISENKQEELKEDIITIDEQNIKNDINKYNWALQIPSISLLAEIEDGTEAEILNRSIGHFTETSTESGNVGLAAHNRRICSKLFWKPKKIKRRRWNNL